MRTSKRMLNDQVVRRLFSAEPTYDPVVRFTVSVNFPKSDPRRKTSKCSYHCLRFARR